MSDILYICVRVHHDDFDVFEPRVKVSAYYSKDEYKVEYELATIYVKPKDKRKKSYNIESHEDSFSWRRMSNEEKIQHEKDNFIKLLGEDMVKTIFKEVWKKMMPYDGCLKESVDELD